MSELHDNIEQGQIPNRQAIKAFAIDMIRQAATLMTMMDSLSCDPDVPAKLTSQQAYILTVSSMYFDSCEKQMDWAIKRLSPLTRKLTVTMGTTEIEAIPVKPE